MHTKAARYLVNFFIVELSTRERYAISGTIFGAARLSGCGCLLYVTSESVGAQGGRSITELVAALLRPRGRGPPRSLAKGGVRHGARVSWLLSVEPLRCRTSTK